MCTRPISRPRVALKRSPVTNKTRAWVSPILRITYGEMTAGAMPSFTSLKARRALSAAMTMSQTAIKPTPPPIAVPLTRATTGQGKLLMVSKRSARRSESVKFCSCVNVADAFIILRSAPALNDGPSPVRTTAWSFSSEDKSLKAACRSWMSRVLKALCTSARRIVTVATLS